MICSILVADIPKLDIGSPSRYYQSYIPQLALVEPMILFACLACASHIMFLMGSVEKSVEEYYNSKVLELLIPLLSSEDATSSNEGLLATTVILRMSEQFLEVGNDAQRHLNGAASLFSGTDWSPVESNLAIACFWTHLRESIRICFLHQQPCHLDLDLSLSGESDEAWTNRMTYLLLRVCTACWGGTDDLKRLKSLVDDWRTHLPRSFRPWCIRETSNEPFPVIKYFAPWHGKLLPRF